ncbi:MAG: sulfotransferase [Planctomycetia bacterium]|jgi:hypothetical protein
MANDTEKKVKSDSNGTTGGYRDRFWYPRFWDGLTIGPWLSMAAKNRFSFSPACLPMVGIVSMLSVTNSTLSLAQKMVYGRKIARTKIDKHPIFIIGHWRSGTTLLHELLVLDEQHTFPDTYTCFAPSHFVLSSPVVPKMCGFLMPKQRPMDNVRAGFGRPQEDEFAICNLGIPSPYRKMAFPNTVPQCEEYLDLDEIPEEALRRWKQGFEWFLKSLTFKTPKRIVLKSPPHTARVKHLLDMFPDARFIHIVRDPYVLFPSTVNLWKRLYWDEGFHRPKYEGLEEYVFERFTQMYTAFERDRHLVPENRFAEVRYEDLVQDFPGRLKQIYGQLELDGFEAVEPKVQKYADRSKSYKTNKYEISDEIRDEIARRWRPYFEKYGYDL